MVRNIIIVCLVILLSYYFGDIDNQFKVMSGNLHNEKVL